MLTFKKHETCDVCKKFIAEINISSDTLRNKKVDEVEKLLFTSTNQQQVSVVFTTDQTEGRPCKPYLSLYKLSLCPDCLQKIYDGSTLYAWGVQGYNTYYFNDGAK